MNKATDKTRKTQIKPGPLLTLGQAAERLSRKRSTVRRLIRAKKLSAVLVGPEILVTERSLVDYLRPKPYAPQRTAPACAGWNDKLRAELAAQQSAGAEP